VRYYLLLSKADGTPLGRETVELPRLPETGTALRPPVCSTPCFVTSAVPASIEATGDVRIAGTIYADVMGEPQRSP
jgi:hypothetical protein